MEDFVQARAGDTSNPLFKTDEQSCLVPSCGDTCPRCGSGTMDYDGLLILTCPECGYQVAGGGFT